MKPVMQTKFGKPDGNCWEACIASILEVALHPEWKAAGTADVHYLDFQGDDWAEKTEAWLADRGLALLRLRIDLYDADERRYWRQFPAYWIGSGPSPHGDFQHAVVYKGIELVHDPHPDADGLATEENPGGYPDAAAVIVPIDLGAWEIPEPVNGTCCACGYSGPEEIECPKRPGDSCCDHWWDGPGDGIDRSRP